MTSAIPASLIALALMTSAGIGDRLFDPFAVIPGPRAAWNPDAEAGQPQANIRIADGRTGERQDGASTSTGLRGDLGQKAEPESPLRGVRNDDKKTASVSRPAHDKGNRNALAWHNAQQMVLVVTPDWDADQGQLRRFTRDANGWHQVGEQQAVTIGKTGAAWGIGLSTPQDDGHPVKREGDGRSPAGVFAIGKAFGYDPTFDTALKYTPMHADSYCVDVSGSPLYNRIARASKVGKAAVKGASEHMRLDLINHGDQRYRMGFVIEHNPAQKPMAGSCIFAHLWKRPGAPTVGCTAMTPVTMRSLLHWLQPARHPVFVLLPREAWQRLQKSWDLPKLGAQP